MDPSLGARRRTRPVFEARRSFSANMPRVPSSVLLQVSRIPPEMSMLELRNIFSECGRPTIHIDVIVEYGSLSEAVSATRNFNKRPPYYFDVAHVNRDELRHHRFFNEPTSVDNSWYRNVSEVWEQTHPGAAVNLRNLSVTVGDRNLSGERWRGGRMQGKENARQSEHYTHNDQKPRSTKPGPKKFEYNEPEKKANRYEKPRNQFGRNRESLLNPTTTACAITPSPSPLNPSPPTPKSPYFEEGETYEVIIQDSVDDTDFFATKVALLKDIEKLQSELNSQISDSFQQLENVAVKSKCVAKYDGQWYRAIIRNLEPLKVLYIDYGNEAVCELTNIKDLPARFKQMPLLTVRIRLPNAASSEQRTAMADGPIKLRVAKKEGNHWLVDFAESERPTSSNAQLEEPSSSDAQVEQPSTSAQVENAPSATIEPDDRPLVSNGSTEHREVIINERPTPAPCNIQSRAEPGMVRHVTIPTAESATDFYVTMVDDLPALDGLVEELKKRVSDASPGFKQQPQIDDWCCKKYDNVWTRARIVSLEPLQVIYVDYGNNEEATVDQLKVLPADLTSVPDFAIKVYLPDITLEEASAVSIKIRFLHQNIQGRWIVDRA
ncbi:hypothetical protein LSTR_LSTR009795 [Laodelphax striatellus]|uniref:Tudor domain-containing protein n=1 Tax=Laodelphax striatellus TaxID=195883 RepID=A0A482XNW7_LAOST|nr:hypothetical protein LSTR_LSTR009795 [Laodelphax striatellus]